MNPRHGWARDFADLQNDSSEPKHDHPFTGSDGLGDEMDAAFRRGREYGRKYSLSQAKSAVKNKPAEYRKEFLRGYQWQRKRERR